MSGDAKVVDDDEPIVLTVERVVPYVARVTAERIGEVRYLSAPAYVRAHHTTEGRTLASILTGLAQSGHPFRVEVTLRRVPLIEWEALS